MSGPTGTFAAPASGPGPVRVGALERLIAEGFGPKELDGGNWGPFIRRMGGYFISPERLASFAPGKKRSGKLLWCALTVCGVIYEELVARGLREHAAQWKRIASASCDDLADNLDDLGWSWRRGAPLPVGLNPQPVDVPGLPARGDLIFYGAVKPSGELDLAHVDFFEAPIAGIEGAFSSVGGNTGWPVADRIDQVKHETADKLARVVLYARVPW